MPRLAETAKNGCLAAKNARLAAKNAAWQQFPLPWQGPGGKCSAKFAGWPKTAARQRKKAEMAKTAVRKAKITISGPSRKKKKTVPLSGTNHPPGSWGQVWPWGIVGGGAAVARKTAARQRKTSAWQKFSLPWQRLGRNRWPPWNPTLVSAACRPIRCHGDVFVCRGSSRALWTFGRRPPSRPAVPSAEGCLGGLTAVATLAHELYWTRVCRQDPR